MKKINSLYSRLLVAMGIASLIFYMAACEKEADEPKGDNKVEITATITSAVEYFSANASATLVRNPGNTIDDHGFCYGTAPGPDITGSKKSLGRPTGTGNLNFSSELTGLTDNTKYYLRAYATLASGTVYGSQKEITTLKAGKPRISTAALSDITLTSAVCGGTIESDSGYAVSASGICWDTDNQFNENQCLGKVMNTSGNNPYSMSIEGLTEGTTYYVKAYATNQKGSGYGEIRAFSTVPVTVPDVTTAAISNPTSNSATGGGNVTNSGNATVTARGVCWNTTGNPTLQNCLGFTTDGQGTGSFTSNLSGLTDGVTYYVKAYGTNTKGTGYGTQQSFTTIAITIPTVTTTAITNPTSNSATSGGNVTNAGNASVTTRGVCWNTTGNPTLQDCLDFTTDGQGTGSFTSNLSGLTDGVTYYVKAYGTNTKGTGYGTQQSFTTLAITIPTVTTSTITNPTTNSATGGGNVTNAGNATVTARGVCWNTTGNPTLQNCINFTTNGNGTGSFTSNITGLSDGVTYYVNAYATNGEGTGYGTEVNFTTLAITLPTVTTTAITNPTNNSATGGGNVTNAGNAAVTARGVCWNTTGNPTLQNCINFTTNGSGTGSFTSNITGLTPSTTYFVRAYATNIEGTAYDDDDVSFTTHPPCGATLSITHTAGTIAPVNKTVNYGIVETNLTGSNKCWITQNLGSDHQATAATDATEASAGWYWQFNRKQGYKHDGSTRTPNTTWISNISENSDWLPANDPCTLLLGAEWRLPTYTEWNNADATGGWDNYNETFASVLKLHAAGYLNLSDGSLFSRGSRGNYWSSSQDDSDGGRNLYFSSGDSYVGTSFKANGRSARCLRD